MWCAMCDVVEENLIINVFDMNRFHCLFDFLLQLTEWKVDVWLECCAWNLDIIAAKCQATKLIWINLNIIELNCWKFHQIFHFRSGSLCRSHRFCPVPSEMSFGFHSFRNYVWNNFFWLNHLLSMVSTIFPWITKIKEEFYLI